MINEKKRQCFPSRMTAPFLLPFVFATIPLATTAHADTLSRIAWCESGGRQYGDDGKVLRSRTEPSMVGMFQIDETVHARPAQRMGLNIYRLDGNLAYARYLYRTQGTVPWVGSKHCWGATAS